MEYKKEERRALIFGASGFVGEYLAKELSLNGYAVHGSDISAPEEGRLVLFESFTTCDLLDMEAVRNVIKRLKPTHIVNLAAVSSVGLSWRIPQKTVEVNVNGGLNILDAARESCHDARILFIGSSEEYIAVDHPICEKTPLNANNPYGLSKLMLERFSEIYQARYGMKVFHVRSFNHTGIGQSGTFVIPSWCRQAAVISKSGSPGVMKVGNTDVIRDFSDVRDIVRAYRLVLESDSCGVVYNIGSGNGIALRDILRELQELSEQPIMVEQEPGLFRPADNPVIVCDHALITERLGWEPRYTITETIKEMFEFYIRDIEKEQLR